MLSSDWLALDVQFLVKSLVMLCRPGAHIRDFHAHNSQPNISTWEQQKYIYRSPPFTFCADRNAEHATYFCQEETQGFFHDGTGTRNVQIPSLRALGRVTREL